MEDQPLIENPLYEKESLSLIENSIGRGFKKYKIIVSYLNHYDNPVFFLKK